MIECRRVDDRVPDRRLVVGRKFCLTALEIHVGVAGTMAGFAGDAELADQRIVTLALVVEFGPGVGRMTGVAGVIPAGHLQAVRSIGRFDECGVTGNPLFLTVQVDDRQDAQVAPLSGCEPVDLHVMGTRCENDRKSDFVAARGRLQLRMIGNLNPVFVAAAPETVMFAAGKGEFPVFEITQDGFGIGDLRHRAVIGFMP